jgi:hypothetical protein
MSDSVDDLIEKMAQHIAPDEPARQEELKAAWRANPKVMDDFAKAVGKGYNLLHYGPSSYPSKH